MKPIADSKIPPPERRSAEQSMLILLNTRIRNSLIYGSFRTIEEVENSIPPNHQLAVLEVLSPGENSNSETLIYHRSPQFRALDHENRRANLRSSIPEKLSGHIRYCPAAFNIK